MPFRSFESLIKLQKWFLAIIQKFKMAAAQSDTTTVRSVNVKAPLFRVTAFGTPR